MPHGGGRWGEDCGVLNFAKSFPDPFTRHRRCGISMHHGTLHARRQCVVQEYATKYSPPHWQRITAGNRAA